MRTTAPLKKDEQELFSYQKINQEKVRIWIDKPLYGRHLSEIQQHHLNVSISQEGHHQRNLSKSLKTHKT